jgi:protein-S-isoprenylcysteine O-methyltransferase Ste14
MLPKVIASLAYVVGMAGAALFMLYLLATGSGLMPPRDAERGPTPWLVNGGLLALFALQHSGMARRAFKTTIVRWIPAELERSMYVAASGTIVALLACFWQPLPGALLWEGPLWIIVFSLLASLGIGWCCVWQNQGEFFGVAQAWSGVADLRGPLRIEGPYRYMRHPLMLGFLIAIWSQPVMPSELFMLNVGLTLYVLIAIRLEERDLVHEFGVAYEKYRNEVPGLVPIRLKL